MYIELENGNDIMFINENTTNDEFLTIGAADGNKTQEEVSTESSVSEETSVESTDEKSETTSEEKLPWPEGGFDSFKNDALPSLVFGMLGIFLVLGLISLATMCLNKLFPGKKDK